MSLQLAVRHLLFPQNTICHRQSLPGSRESGVGRNVEQGLRNLPAVRSIAQSNPDVQFQSQVPTHSGQCGNGDQAFGPQVEPLPAPDFSGKKLNYVALEVRRNPVPEPDSPRSHLQSWYRLCGPDHESRLRFARVLPQEGLPGQTECNALSDGASSSRNQGNPVFQAHILCLPLGRWILRTVHLRSRRPHQQAFSEFICGRWAEVKVAAIEIAGPPL